MHFTLLSEEDSNVLKNKIEEKRKHKSCFNKIIVISEEDSNVLKNKIEEEKKT